MVAVVAPVGTTVIVTVTDSARPVLVALAGVNGVGTNLPNYIPIQQMPVVVKSYQGCGYIDVLPSCFDDAGRSGERIRKVQLVD